MELLAPAAEFLALEKLRAQELDEALQIQSAMLPASPLHDARVSVVHRFQPVSEVGGDFLDYFLLPDNSLGLYLGDVSGKGLPAALYAALAVGTLRGIPKAGACPGAVLSLLNKRLLVRSIPRRFAAIQYAVLNPAGDVMRIASGGLFGPLLLTSQGCVELHLPGMPPGMFLEADYPVTSLRLGRGDSVLFFTDGISEAMDEQGEQFGVERLRQVCADCKQESPGELLARIFAAIESFVRGEPQHDDMTAAVVHLNGGRVLSRPGRLASRVPGGCFRVDSPRGFQ